MNNDMYDRLMVSSLKQISAVGAEADELAYTLYRLARGEEADAFAVLKKYGYIDEDREWLD